MLKRSIALQSRMIILTYYTYCIHLILCLYKNIDYSSFKCSLNSPDQWGPGGFILVCWMQRLRESATALQAAKKWLVVEWPVACLFQWCCVVWYFKHSCRGRNHRVLLQENAQLPHISTQPWNSHTQTCTKKLVMKPIKKKKSKCIHTNAQNMQEQTLSDIVLCTLPKNVFLLSAYK